MDSGLITNRPKELLEIEYYSALPRIPVGFNYGSLPAYLNADLFALNGILPKTCDLISEAHVFDFLTQPSEQEIDYYRKRQTKFQIINVVANIHTFKKISDDLVHAYPYHISLVASPKSGRPEECSIGPLSALNLDQLPDFVYTDFSPFKPVDRGFLVDSSFLVGADHDFYTDTVGFILETYFLATDSDLEDVALHGPSNHDPIIFTKFRKHRIKKYFKPFTDIKPRKIWGCDSPIELFMVQALAKRGVFPVIQALIFKNGQVFPNFFEMIKSNVFMPADDLITEVDFYFPEQKLAVFCDSVQFHRGKKNKDKDKFIDEQLGAIGISSLRITGKQIIKDLNGSVDLVCQRL
jgi:hypothetical protein